MAVIAVTVAVAMLGSCGGRQAETVGDGGLRFVDVSSEAGLPLAGATTGVVFVDLNGDGSRDLLIGRHSGAPRAFQNRGACQFEPVPGWRLDLGEFDHHATVADHLDGDGILDFYLVAGAHRGEGVGANVFFSSAAGELVDVAVEWGVSDPFGRGRGGVLLDPDGDGSPDLFVLNFRTAPRCFAMGAGPPAVDTAELRLGVPAADDEAIAAGAPRTRAEFVVSLLPTDLDRDGRTEFLALGGGLPIKILRTDGDGARVDVAAIPPAAYLPEPRGAVWGDFDGDGQQDLFLVYGADDEPSHFDLERRNRLLLRRGDGFEDHTPPVLTDEGRGVHCAAADLDNDGNLDLAVLRTRRDHRESRLLLYRNRGGDAIDFEAAREFGPYAGIADGLLASDIDADGDLDLVVLNGAVDTDSADGGVRLLKNTSRRHHTLLISFDTTPGERLPYGAVVTVTAGGRTQVRQFWPTQVGGSAFRDRMHIGLGPATRVESLHVVWPDGRELRLADIAADRTIHAHPAP